MPLKTIFNKPPLLTVHQAFPSNGLVRTKEPSIKRIYLSALDYQNDVLAWEGIFNLACLVLDDPSESPVFGLIISSLKDTEDGSLDGSLCEQIACARAAFALFEYNTDPAILRRLGKWFRYLEIEWQTFFTAGKVIFSPADLMELMIRYYSTTGMKAVLRLCSRLRIYAFDWTTALHTIQQALPVTVGTEPSLAMLENKGKDDLDYDEKQLILNHAEMIADGMRFCAYSGLFSGNGQDLSAGKEAWNYLKKHHSAVCGATTSSPWLSGTASNAGVDTAALSAWIEAFSASLVFQDSNWAADELVRIVFNALSFLLRQETIPKTQYVNKTGTDSQREPITSGTMARLSRAVACAYRHAVGITENRIRINYLIPVQASVISDGVQIRIVTDSDGAVFHFKERSDSVRAEIFISSVDSADYVQKKGNDLIPFPAREESKCVLSFPLPVRHENALSVLKNDRVCTESAHHQGITIWKQNHLLCVPVSEGRYQYAFSSLSDAASSEPVAQVRKISSWRIFDGEAEDIPVLPRSADPEIISIGLKDYDQEECRIALLPRLYHP